MVEHLAFNQQVLGSSPKRPTTTKEKTLIDFTIMEFNFDTKQYTTVGLVEAPNSKQAKELFIKNNNWVARDGIFLLAKPPLCR